MPKILHTADWHWGAPGVHPFYSSQLIPKLVQAAEDNGCEYILVAGDVFDKPKPDQQLKDLLVADLLKYQKKVKFIFSVGNHDYTTKAMTYHSLNYLHYIIKAGKGKLNIHLIEPGQEYEDDQILIYSVDSVEWEARNTDMPYILVWHATFPGLDFKNLEKSSKTVEKKVEAILKTTGAQYLALGDIHRPLCLSKHRAYYPGPPVQKTYADKAGYIVYDTDKKRVSKKKLDLPTKENLYFYDYDIEKNTEEEIITQVKEGVDKGSLVKLRFEMPLSSWVTLNHIRIKEGLAKHCNAVVLDNTPVPERRTKKVTKSIGKATSMEEEITIVVNDSDVDVDKTKLKKVCISYV